MIDLIIKVTGHKFYSKIDLKNAQVMKAKYFGNWYLLRFVPVQTSYFWYSIKKNFCRMVNIIKDCFPYLNEIIIYSDSKQDHYTVLLKIINLLQENNVNINYWKMSILSK